VSVSDANDAKNRIEVATTREQFRCAEHWFTGRAEWLRWKARPHPRVIWNV